MVQAEYNAELARTLLRCSPLTLEERLGVGFGQSWLHSAVHASMTALICSFEQDFTHQAEQGEMATCA